jgi:hypothetical protein
MGVWGAITARQRAGVPRSEARSGHGDLPPNDARPPYGLTVNVVDATALRFSGS